MQYVRPIREKGDSVELPPPSANAQEHIELMTLDANHTKDLIETFKEVTKDEEEGEIRTGVDRWVFGAAAAVAIAFLVWGLVDSDGLGTVASSALSGVITNFGWLFVIAASVFVVFVLVVAFTRFGRIRVC